MTLGKLLAKGYVKKMEIRTRQPKTQSCHGDSDSTFLSLSKSHTIPDGVTHSNTLSRYPQGELEVMLLKPMFSHKKKTDFPGGKNIKELKYY